MKIFLVLASLFAFVVAEHDQPISNNENCTKPLSNLPFNTIDAWRRKYAMVESKSGFVIKNFHFSAQTFPNMELGGFEREVAHKHVYAYSHLFNVKTAGLMQKFRRSNYGLIWHFYHGQGAILYNLVPETKELITLDMRKEKEVHFFVVKPNTWYAFDYPEEGPDSFSFLGATSIRATNDISTFEFGTRESLLRDFPMHSDVINKIMA